MSRALAFALACGLLLAAAPVSPLASAGERTASGLGSIHFQPRHDDHRLAADDAGDEEIGVAMFEFNVTDDDGITGSMLVAAEHHSLYPEFIVRVDSIKTARFTYRRVELTAHGFLHDEPVTVRAHAYDGVGTKKKDSFAIKCVNESGEVVFEAEGELHSGDIVVGALD